MKRPPVMLAAAAVAAAFLGLAALKAVAPRDAGSQTSLPAPPQKDDLDFSNLGFQLYEGHRQPVEEPRVRALRIEQEDSIGCHDWLVLQRIVNSSHDFNAFRALVLPRLATTECIVWDVGTQIRKEQIEPPVGRDDVRRIVFKCYARVGDAGPCYWTNVDATAKHGR